MLPEFPTNSLVKLKLQLFVVPLDFYIPGKFSPPSINHSSCQESANGMLKPLKPSTRKAKTGPADKKRKGKTGDSVKSPDAAKA